MGSPLRWRRVRERHRPQIEALARVVFAVRLAAALDADEHVDQHWHKSTYENSWLVACEALDIEQWGREQAACYPNGDLFTLDP